MTPPHIQCSNRKILYWELIGIVFLVCVGSLLHFTYAWSDYSPFVGLFSSVNESVWEHLKLGFTSLVIFSLIEFWFIKKDAQNFFLAKAVGILYLQLFIVIFFYGYTFLTGTEILLVDILSYIVGCIICQLVSFRILINKKLPESWNIAGMVFLFLHAIILMMFTFYSPELPIIKNPHADAYGTT
ncbi:MAG: DUF6512 family protein [bacterium]|nr:DUF6512 family protein [bacterium]